MQQHAYAPQPKYQRTVQPGRCTNSSLLMEQLSGQRAASELCLDLFDASKQGGKLTPATSQRPLK